MEKMQAMTEMNLIEICHRITQVERALTCTKEFSIKFNGHMKLITSLVNSLYEEEESLILFEQKIEQRVDHYHKRVFFRRERNGEERVVLEDENDNNHNHNHYKYQNEYGLFDDPRNGGREGNGLVGTWNGENDIGRGRGYSGRNNRQGIAKSVEHMLDGERNNENNEIRSEYQGNKGYRKDMDNLGNVQGKRGVLVNDFKTGTVDSIDDGNHRTSEEIAVSKKLDLFMKESDLLKEVIKNGESNAKHLKECLFKLIDAFKDQNKNKNNNNNQKISEKRVEKTEKIIREEGGEVLLIRLRKITDLISIFIIIYQVKKVI